MRNLILSFLVSLALVGTCYSQDFGEYFKLLQEYEQCAKMSQVFSGGPDCIKPVCDLPNGIGCTPAVTSSDSVYIDKNLYMKNIVIISDDGISIVKYARMVLVDHSFVIVEIVE